MKITRYHVFIGLMMLLFLIGIFYPHENNYPAINDDNFTDNFTNMSQPADQGPLMSTPDNDLSEEKGWWKHVGRSTVSGGNVPASGTSGESSGNNDNKGSEEVPEFPNLVIPLIVVTGIAMLFSRK
ncbi:hypothetical protein [Methanolobus vulcani]|uniref:Uncharacterized protein n=1 Tax=Methanolobus vulcani TaxID=38026 RepID=A0A7Z8KPC4_9EURY|nr:hypothetical protein [Methanolobus vulcani]TQD25250.1 hypothetical protein FKV42_09410 [Methanolobus vulcani]